MSRVARSYYLDGRSKSDIAAELNISRFRVARPRFDGCCGNGHDIGALPSRARLALMRRGGSIVVEWTLSV